MTISEQLRNLILASLASPYAIGKIAGVSKSAMSRFMNGGSLAMNKLDALATLGDVTLTGQFNTPPLKLGRPSK